MQKTTFIYALCEPGTRTVRYIGKTDKPQKRFIGHLSSSRRKKSHLGCWLKSLWAEGKRPDMEILDEVLTDQWEFWEREYIRVFRAIGFDLVNATDGGEGAFNPSPETRVKISKSRQGERNHQFGKPRTQKECAAISAGLTGLKRSPEAREAIRQGKLGEKNPQFGKPQTKESNAKRSAALMGEKNHQFGKGKPHTPEEKAAIKAGMSAAKARKEARDQEIEWALAPYTLE